jgi:hypothetical protein
MAVMSQPASRVGTDVDGAGGGFLDGREFFGEGGEVGRVERPEGERFG